MEEKDFQRIEQMIGNTVSTEVTKAVKTELGSVKEEIKAVRAEIRSVKEEIITVRTQVGSFKEEIKSDFRLQTGILSEDFHHKLQLVAEGHQMLSEKIDRIHNEIVETKDSVNAVAADVVAHRTDTEGHKRGYLIKES